MVNVEPTIRATALNGFAEFLAAKHGIALGDLLAEVGIDARPPWENSTSVPLHKYAALLELASKRSHEDCLGFELAAVFPQKASSVLGYLLAVAPDLRKFLECLSRYARLQIDAVNLSFREESGLLRIRWDYDATFIGPRKQLTELLMCLFMRRAIQLFGQDLRPVAAEFEYREPPCINRYHDLFGNNLRFGGETNILTTRSDIMSRRAVAADEVLYRELRRLAEQDLQSIETESDILARVHKEIVRRLALDMVDLEAVAGALGLSCRQLQTQLKRAGTSFEAALNSVRLQIASRYLRETDLPMTDIALLLGFSELSSFTRAARNWFHMPPTTYRLKAREGLVD